jgi:hypothetical protein
MLFPQPPYAGYGNPETVWLSPPAGTINSGPSDDRMYVIDVVDKAEPYSFPYLPPYYGAAYPPVSPGIGGHFDHLDQSSREFAAAHVYGSARRVLDIWESFLGSTIPWYFSPERPRLEVIPLIKWDNAQSGYGFLELGASTDEEGNLLPYALNFDVIGHEIGHMILFGLMGIPEPALRTAYFYGFHEACADITAMIGILHFDSAVDRLLRSTKGNLYTLNELNRIAELADHRQIRLASNSRKLSDVTDDPHELSLPFTGAVFDILVDLFVDGLLSEGLIDRRLASTIRRTTFAGEGTDQIQLAFNEAYKNRHYRFKSLLCQARDVVGKILARVWETLPARDLSYKEAVEYLIEADSLITGGRCRKAIAESFTWRGITVGS